MPRSWIQTPSDQTLSTLGGWAKLGENHYAALRSYLLVVERQDPKTASGPVHYKVDLPVGAEAVHSNKKIKLLKYMLGLEQTIQSTITSKLTTEVLSKTGISLDAAAVGAKLSSEIEAKIGQELVNSLQSGLSTTKTFEIQTSQEDEREVKFVVSGPNGQKQTRTVIAHLELRRIFWDIYLYRVDFLQLEHKKRWYWTDVRETIVRDSSTPCRPLFTIQFYEPQEELSFKFDEYVPEVNEPDQMEAMLLDTPCPKAIPPELRSLEVLARLAFPVSKKELRQSYERYGRDIAAAGSGGRRATKKSAAARKPAASAARKSSAAKKPAAKKPAAKKPMAAKKTAAKKPAASKKATAAKKSAAKKG